MRVYDVADGTFQPVMEKIADFQCFFGKCQRIDQDRPLRTDNCPGIDLGIDIACKDVNILGNPLSDHRASLRKSDDEA